MEDNLKPYSVMTSRQAKDHLFMVMSEMDKMRQEIAGQRQYLSQQTIQNNNRTDEINKMKFDAGNKMQMEVLKKTL